MKIKPLNQTALMVSWERPLAVYHPPITSYMVSYSWVRRDVADERTFTKTGDQSMVCIIVSSGRHWQRAPSARKPLFFFGTRLSRCGFQPLPLVCRAGDVSGQITGRLDR